MARQGFKNNVSDGWLFKQELRFFRNFIRNWTKEVGDDDFFEIFSNRNNATREQANAMIEKHFAPRDVMGLGEFEIAHVVEWKDEAGEPVKDLVWCDSRDRMWNDCKHKPVGLRIVGRTECAIQALWNQKNLRARCHEMLKAWCDQMERAKSKSCKRKDPMEDRMSEVIRVLKLDETERELLMYAAVRRHTCFDSFPEGNTNGRHDRQIYLAMAIDKPVSSVLKALKDGSRLRRYDVLDEDGDLKRSVAIANYIVSGGDELLEGEFYKKADLSETLPWAYYGRLAEKHGDILKEMIGSCRGKKGVNILLYGAPGTGKTSFAKTLAKELGLDLFEIRQGDRDGDRNSPASRMAGIQICNEQVPRETSLVMVDEADCLLRTNLDSFGRSFGMASQSSEKGVVNTLLDGIRIPTIWISNAQAWSMDDSVRRRFDYSICFEKLSTAQRKSIWQNNVEKLHLEKLVPQEMMDRMAGKYPTSAGGITMVLENLKRMKPRKDRVESLIDKLMTPHCELMEATATDDRLLPSKDYSLEGLNISGEIGLERIVTAVRNYREEQESGVKDPDRPRMNLLMYGPPGTGKTEFVKYLGKTLGQKVVVKMGSDILSMWVGGTEKNIRNAFREAEEEKAILFLDEIDGLVQDRSGAQRSWEVTQVNELLHQMENFNGVMIGATNFMDNLDQAILRRFTFKLQFDYLKEDGKKLFFERLFKSSLSESEAAELAAVPNLAPGDFRTVRQSMYYLGGDVTNAQRISALVKESSLKRDTKKSGKIGF